MRLRIEIKTPTGYAISTANQLKPFILGTRKVEKHDVYANKANDKIIWIVDADIKDALRIQKNVAFFAQATSMILKSKVVQGLAKLSKEDQLELNKMLTNQTKIRIIKIAEEMPNLQGWDKEI